jgi:hypothetical protein
VENMGDDAGAARRAGRGFATTRGTMTRTIQSSLLQTIEDLLHDEGWREIVLEACEEGFTVEARHESDQAGTRVMFGLGPADLDAIMRMSHPVAC